MIAAQQSNDHSVPAADDWKDLDSNFISNWLTSHMNVAKQLGKPLILEEVSFLPSDLTGPWAC